MRLFCVMLAVASALNFASPSYGTLITAGGVAQFYDDFEAGTVGSAPDNGTQPGGWASVTAGVTVTNASSPAAAEGSKYLDVTRTGSDGDAYAVMETAQSTSGTAIRAEWMQYIPSTGWSSYCSNLQLQSGDGSVIPVAILTGLKGPGTVQYLSPDGPAWTNTTLTYVADTWQKWTVDYAVGAATYTIGIDGASQTVSAYQAGGVGRMYFTGSSAGGTFYMDAMPVPEPSTVALLATGLISLLAYAWRNRG